MTARITPDPRVGDEGSVLKVCHLKAMNNRTHSQQAQELHPLKFMETVRWNDLINQVAIAENLAIDDLKIINKRKNCIPSDL